MSVVPLSLSEPCWSLPMVGPKQPMLLRAADNDDVETDDEPEEGDEPGVVAPLDPVDDFDDDDFDDEFDDDFEEDIEDDDLDESVTERDLETAEDDGDAEFDDG